MLSTPPAFILSQDQTLMLKSWSKSGLLSLANYPKPSLLGFCSEFSQIQRSKPDLLFSEFSGFYILFNLQLSRFFVVVHLSGNSFIIPQSQLFVNNFLNFIFLLFSQQASSGKKSGERGIWTLAPVSRPTPLAGAPLRPLEYFSEFIISLWCL